MASAAPAKFVIVSCIMINKVGIDQGNSSHSMVNSVISRKAFKRILVGSQHFIYLIKAIYTSQVSYFSAITGFPIVRYPPAAPLRLIRLLMVKFVSTGLSGVNHF